MAEGQDYTLPAYRYFDDKPKQGTFRILLTLPGLKVKTRGIIHRKSEPDGSTVDVLFTERSVTATISIPKEKKHYRFTITKLPEDIQIGDEGSSYELDKGKINLYLKKMNEFNSWKDYTEDILPDDCS